jgi:branched-chain amino acid transport system permease protein
LFFGNETKILRPGVEATYHIGSVILTRIQIAQVIAAVLLVPWLLLFIRDTRWGKMIRAVRDNPVLAMVMGVDLHAVRLMVFVIGSVLGGVAAILSALDVGMDPYVGMPALLVAAVAMIVGGVGTFGGAVVGALLLGILQSLVIWQVSARWTDALTFGLLILFVLFRPQGLLGGRRRLEETSV